MLFGSGLGWALDAMDVGLISFIIAALGQHWQLEKGELGLITSIGFVGMAIGATLGGLLADRFGRRQVFAVTLLIYGLATGASALAGGIAMLLVLRFFVGLGLGAELPVASTYVSEFAPARIRGRLIVILEAFWAVGWTASALIGYFVVPASEHGWRWAFALGAIPAVYALIVRWGLPESPRWLAGRGRCDEAAHVVADFASSPAIGRRGSAPTPAVSTDMPAAPSRSEAPAEAPIATSAGRRLAALARTHQVIVVTHLAQVAAFADDQVVVSKDVDGTGARTTVRPVTGDERTAEIARMLSGEPTSEALRHAEALLARPGGA